MKISFFIFFAFIDENQFITGWSAVLIQWDSQGGENRRGPKHSNPSAEGTLSKKLDINITNIIVFSSISYITYQYHHHHHHHHLQNDLWCTGGAGLHRNWCLLCITPERSWYSTPSTFCKLVQQFPQLLWVELFLKTFLYTSRLNAAGTVPSHDYYTCCKVIQQQGLDWIVGPGYNSGGNILGCS